MFKSHLCRIILLSTCLTTQAAFPTSWHVLHLFTNCNHTIMHSKTFFDRFMPLVVTSLKQSNAHLAKFQMPVKETVMEFEKPHQIYHYCALAPRFSAHVMVMPNLSQTTIDIYCEEDTYDRDAMTAFGKAFFRANEATHRTSFIEEK